METVHFFLSRQNKLRATERPKKKRERIKKDLFLPPHTFFLSLFFIYTDGYSYHNTASQKIQEVRGGGWGS